MIPRPAQPAHRGWRGQALSAVFFRLSPGAWLTRRPLAPARASVPVLGALVLVALLAALAAQLALGQPSGPGEFPEHKIEPLRFAAIDVFIDSGAAPLAAYQLELKTTPGQAGAPDLKLVGVEGGDHAAYRQPPYYDPAALHENALHERIVLAAFSTAADLPAGKTRIARLHLQLTGGDPAFAISVQAAGTADGTRIEATATWAPAQAGTGDRR